MAILNVFILQVFIQDECLVCNGFHLNSLEDLHRRRFSLVGKILGVFVVFQNGCSWAQQDGFIAKSSLYKHRDPMLVLTSALAASLPLQFLACSLGNQEEDSP